MSAGELMLLFSAFAPAVIAARLEKLPWGVYGLPWRWEEVRKFLPGAVVGFGCLSLLLWLIHLFHGLDLGTVQLHGGDAVRYGVLWAGAFLLVGFAEEFLFRGYSQFTMARGKYFWRAAVVLSLVFGAAHLNNFGEDWMGAVAAFLVGLVLAFSLWRTGSLWFAVGAHTAWDWAESYFYGVPDSGSRSAGTLFSAHFSGSKWVTGGSVGPEGSVLIVVAVAVMALVIHLLYPKPAWGMERMQP